MLCKRLASKLCRAGESLPCDAKTILSLTNRSLERVLERDPSDVDTLQFLDDLEEWVGSQDSPELSTTVLSWISTHRKKRWDVLKTPATDEYEAITELAMKHTGGLGLLENKYVLVCLLNVKLMISSRILPMLKSTSDCSNLLDYVLFLQDDMSTHLPPSTLSRIVRELLAHALPMLSLPSQSSSKSPTSHEAAPTSQADLFVQGCLALGDDYLLIAGLAKINDLAISMLPSATNYEVARILFALIRRVVEHAGKRTVLGLANLCKTAVLLWLAVAEAQPASVTSDDMSTAFKIISVGEHAAMIVS